MKLTYKHLLPALVAVAFVIGGVTKALGQDDLLRELAQSSTPERKFTFATFKGTRVLNGHSVETKNKGELEVFIAHRFGRLNSGPVNFWGLDESYIRIGLEYGITDRLGVGVGRNSYYDIYDAYLKYKVVRQREGGAPFTITALTAMGLQTYPTRKDDSTLSFFDRASYTYELLIARKLSPGVSVQFTPGLVHTNRVDQTLLKNNQFFLGIGGRCKLTPSLSLNVEYFARINPLAGSPYHNCIGIGFDLETGGHVFQFIFSNTQGMIERTFINESEGRFFKGGINFGFNITRMFQLGRKPGD